MFVGFWVYLEASTPEFVQGTSFYDSDLLRRT